MGFAGFERKAASERANEADGPYTWPMWYEGRVDPTPSAMPTYAREGYGQNAVVFACISRKAMSASMARPVAYAGDRMRPERLGDDAPLAMLLRRPNRWMSWYELQELAITYLELDGNAFFYKARVGLGPTTALYPLRPDRVRPVPKNGEMLGYVYDGADTGMFEGKTPFLPDEIVHIKYPNPRDPFEGLGRGQPRLAAALLDVRLDNQNVSFLNAFFRNAAVPFGLLKTKQKLLDNEVNRIRSRVREQYAGSNNWHDIMILDADADYQKLGLDMKELEFDALDSRNEARICMVCGVPPIIAGARLGIEHGTYSNYGEARGAFWEDELVPLYTRFEDGWNLGLADEFAGQWVAYDYSDVPALQENANDAHKRAVEAWTKGLVKRNEARAMIDLEPDPLDGYIGDLAGRPDMAVDPMWRAPQTAGTGDRGLGTGEEDDAVEEDGDEEDDAGDGKFSPGGAEGKPLVLGGDADEPDEERMAVERRAEESLVDALDRQRRELIGDDPEAIVSADVVAARVPETSGTVRDALRRMLIESVDLGVRIGVRDLERVGIGFDWTLASTAARDYANEYVGELITRINETTKRQVRQAVAAWVMNGDPLQSLVDELAVTFGEQRAKLISSTEVTNAYAEGKVASYRASGVIRQKQWNTARDEIAAGCVICGPLHGVEADLDEAFVHPVTGKTYQNPSAHPQCRCWVTGVVDD
jgi:HK97 family phage portal protein